MRKFEGWIARCLSFRKGSRRETCEAKNESANRSEEAHHSRSREAARARRIVLLDSRPDSRRLGSVHGRADVSCGSASTRPPKPGLVSRRCRRAAGRRKRACRPPHRRRPPRGRRGAGRPSGGTGGQVPVTLRRSLPQLDSRAATIATRPAWTQLRTSTRSTVFIPVLGVAITTRPLTRSSEDAPLIRGHARSALRRWPSSISARPPPHHPELVRLLNHQPAPTLVWRVSSSRRSPELWSWRRRPGDGRSWSRSLGN
jgi:hypothetical protein